MIRIPSTDNLKCSQYPGYYKQLNLKVYLCESDKSLFEYFKKHKNYDVFNPKNSISRKIKERELFECRTYNISLADVVVVDTKSMDANTEVYVDCMLTLSLKLPLIVYINSNKNILDFFIKKSSADQIVEVFDINKIDRAIYNGTKNNPTKYIPESIMPIIDAGRKNISL